MNVLFRGARQRGQIDPKENQMRHTLPQLIIAGSHFALTPAEAVVFNDNSSDPKVIAHGFKIAQKRGFPLVQRAD
jgi:hypothetical protein